MLISKALPVATQRVVTLLVLLLSGYVGSGRAAVPIPPTLLPIESTADRMISYRHQEHMWQTSDGATHVLVNVGDDSPGASLVLYSTFDSGLTWQPMFSVTGSEYYSTSDGRIVNDMLGIVFGTAAGNVAYAAYRYNATASTWTPVLGEIVFSQEGQWAFNPAFALDSSGAIWCAFVVRNESTSQTNIRMMVRPNNGMGVWQNTGLTFGPTDALQVERSARPVPTSNGVGMIYTVHDTMYWSTRIDGAAVTAPWNTSTLFAAPPPYNADPYASHFSVVADLQKNLHVAAVDNGRLIYIRYVNSSKTWQAPRALTSGDVRATYPQISYSGGAIIIASNVSNSAGVLQSTDKGTTWAYTHLLEHPAAAEGEDYNNPRIEMPGYSASPIPVMQQYQVGERFELMLFPVPVLPE
jgi:hypothetical protein